MMDAAQIWKEILLCIPCFSAGMWLVLLLIARCDCRITPERNIKNTLILYYICSFTVWLAFYFYNYLPIAFVHLNSLMYAAALFMVVSFYQYVCRLTTLHNNESISPLHYLIALIVPLALFIYSFYVPIEVQEMIVEQRGEAHTSYFLYSILFLSKPTVLFLYGLVYTVASIRKLHLYYIEIKKKEDAPIRISHWLLTITGITLTLLMFSMFMFFVGRSENQSIWTPIVILTTCAQNMILGYNAIKRNFIPHYTEKIIEDDEEEEFEEEEMEEDNQSKNKMKRKYTHIAEIRYDNGKWITKDPLTKEKFDALMLKKKPYLNRDFKITDLIVPLKANRTALSRFVNSTYGINFAKYINRLRLEDVKKLQSIPTNQNTNLATIVECVGFTDLRHYARAIGIEREINPEAEYYVDEYIESLLAWGDENEIYLTGQIIGKREDQETIPKKRGRPKNSERKKRLEEEEASKKRKPARKAKTSSKSRTSKPKKQETELRTPQRAEPNKQGQSATDNDEEQ